MKRNAVVRPDRLDLQPERLPEPCSKRERPRRVHTGAERGEDAETPVADLVTETLDHDGPVRRYGAGRGSLLVQERQQVARGPVVEQMLVTKTGKCFLLGERNELARCLADRRAELVRTADTFALPERHGAGHAWSRRDEDAVARNLLDPPGRRAEQERLAGPRLVDHLLVEFANTAAAVDEIHAKKTAIRDCSGIRHGQPTGAAATADDAGGAIPDDARPELGELVGRITPGQHVKRVLELRA